MANRRPLQYPRYQAWGSDETFLDGGTIEFFDAGTSNNRNVYQDAALTTTAPNPVTLNSRGEPQSAGGTAIDLYLDNGAYKIVLKDSSGTTIHTIDNYIETQDVLEPKDPADATDQATDVFEGQLNSDPASGETFQVDFQDANTTTTPTFENTSGSLGALTIKTRDRSALWSGALNSVHELYYDGTDYLVLDPETTKGVVEPEHATDSGTDAYVSATNTTAPAAGVQIVRDFQSANTTSTPTLDSKTITDRLGNAVWPRAINGPHDLEYVSGTDTYLLLDPRPIDEDDMASDSDAAVPTQQSVAAFVGAEKIEAGSVSNASSLDITDLSSDYRAYMLVYDDLLPATDGADLHLLISSDNGSNFETGASDYEYATIHFAVTGSVSAAGSNSDSKIEVINNFGNNATTGEEGSGTITIHNPNSADSPCRASWKESHVNSGSNFQISTGDGGLRSSTDINAIRLVFSAGNIATMNYTLYGMR